MGRRIMAFFMLALFLGTFLGCDRKPEVKGPKVGTKPQAAGVPFYHFAVHPLHNPEKLFQAYQPLIDSLNSRLQGARLTLEASRDYEVVRRYVARFESEIRPVEEKR